MSRCPFSLKVILKSLLFLIPKQRIRVLLVFDEVVKVGIVVPALALTVDQEIGFDFLVIVNGSAVLVLVIVHLAVKLPFLDLKNMVELAARSIEFLGRCGRRARRRRQDSLIRTRSGSRDGQFGGS